MIFDIVWTFLIYRRNAVFSELPNAQTFCLCSVDHFSLAFCFRFPLIRPNLFIIFKSHWHLHFWLFLAFGTLCVFRITYSLCEANHWGNYSTILTILRMYAMHLDLNRDQKKWILGICVKIVFSAFSVEWRTFHEWRPFKSIILSHMLKIYDVRTTVFESNRNRFECEI